MSQRIAQLIVIAPRPVGIIDGCMHDEPPDSLSGKQMKFRVGFHAIAVMRGELLLANLPSTRLAPVAFEPAGASCTKASPREPDVTMRRI